MEKTPEQIRETDEYYCTCEAEIIKPHICPKLSEVHDDYSLCTCCDGCLTKCADDI